LLAPDTGTGLLINQINNCNSDVDSRYREDEEWVHDEEEE
jgi:hypothetical protein